MNLQNSLLKSTTYCQGISPKSLGLIPSRHVQERIGAYPLDSTRFGIVFPDGQVICVLPISGIGLIVLLAGIFQPSNGQDEGSKLLWLYSIPAILALSCAYVVGVGSGPIESSFLAQLLPLLLATTPVGSFIIPIWMPTKRLKMIALGQSLIIAPVAAFYAFMVMMVLNHMTF